MHSLIFTKQAYAHQTRAAPIAWSMHRPGALVVVTVIRRA